MQTYLAAGNASLQSLVWAPSGDHLALAKGAGLLHCTIDLLDANLVIFRTVAHGSALLAWTLCGSLLALQAAEQHALNAVVPTGAWLQCQATGLGSRPPAQLVAAQDCMARMAAQLVEYKTAHLAWSARDDLLALSGPQLLVACAGEEGVAACTASRIRFAQWVPAPGPGSLLLTLHEVPNTFGVSLELVRASKSALVSERVLDTQTMLAASAGLRDETWTAASLAGSHSACAVHPSGHFLGAVSPSGYVFTAHLASGKLCMSHQHTHRHPRTWVRWLPDGSCLALDPSTPIQLVVYHEYGTLTPAQPIGAHLTRLRCERLLTFFYSVLLSWAGWPAWQLYKLLRWLWTCLLGKGGDIQP